MEASNEPLILKYPYSPPAPIMPEDVPVTGALCDPRFRDLYSRLLAYRYDTAFFRFTRNGVTGALELAAGQQITLFSAGINETSPQTGGGVLDPSDCTQTQNGGLVQTANRWLSMGARISIEEAYAVAPGASGNGARVYSAFLRRPDFGYARTLAAAIGDSVSAEVNHGSSNACRYTLGALAELGDCGQTSELPLSQGGLPGQFWYFATPDNSGGSRDSDQLNMILTANKGITVEQNAMNPTLPNLDFIVAVRVGLVGVPFCPGPLSADPTTQAAINAAVVEALRKSGMKV